MTESSTPSGAAVASPLVRVRFGRFELDEANALLLRDGKGIDLAPMPFAVLCALARAPGGLRTKNALLDEVWGHRFVSESVLKTVIRNLRAALEDDAREPRIIETVSRRGYRFIAPVAPIAGVPPSSVAKALPTLPADASFIGREDALGRLQTLWSDAREGKRLVAWVAGEPGIGKTTLIERFAANAPEAMCIRGQCVEQHGAGEPYLPVLEALNELCRRDKEAVALLRAVAPAWLLQLPWLTTAEERDALRGELAGSTGDRMMREMAELIDRYTERQPLLLVTEDLHWSDRPTVQLMDHVARRRGSARFMWLSTFRTADVVAMDHPLNRLRRELRLHGLCDEIALDPFSEKEVGEYVARFFPALAADEPFIRALHERTDGLPLFVAHVASEVLSSAGPAGSGIEPAELVPMTAVPGTVSAMIEHQIERLSADDRFLLSAAAVCGVEFRGGTVAHALERDLVAVAEACERIVLQHIWLAPVPPREGDEAGDPAYRFRHALLRQVLYQHSASPLRTQLHGKVAAALVRERDRGRSVAAAELADHFERAGDTASAVRHLVDAAKAALMHFSPEECIALAERGEQLVAKAPIGKERDEAELSLAALQGVAASHVFSLSSPQANASLARAYALIERVGDHPMRPMLLNGFGLSLAMRGEYAEALAVAQRAEAIALPGQPPLLMIAAAIVRADVLMLQGQAAAAVQCIERALPAVAALEKGAERTFVSDPGVTLLAILALSLLHLGRVREFRQRMNEAHARAQACGQPMARVVALWLDGLCGVRLGNVERVAALSDEMHRLVDEFALMDGRNASRWLRGWAQVHMGEPQAGYRMIRAACEESAARNTVAGASENLGYVAEALLLAGDAQGAQAELDRAMAIVSTYDERIYLPQLHVLAAGIARAHNDVAASLAALERAIAEARSQRSPWLELLGRAELCEHAPSKRHREALATLLRELPEAKGTPLGDKARGLLP